MPTVAKEGRQDFLHFSFCGEHVLFEILSIDSFSNFFWASLLTVLVCLAERALTFVLAKDWKSPTRHSRLRVAVWKTALYWAAMMLRLLYMLIVMSYNLGLILVTATALAAGQLVIEYLDVPEATSRDSYRVKEPLLDDSIVAEDHPYMSNHPMTNRPRSRSKPENIFIHPDDSNLFRADAVALEMGITGDTELVKNSSRPGREESWSRDDGEDRAREILASTSRMKFPS